VINVTPIVAQANGQLLITADWKNFTIQIEGVNVLTGFEVCMMTTTNLMNPFSYQGGSTATQQDLMQVAGCFGAMPGFGNYIPELDYNHNSVIDICDLSTVAANM
jgi:hypothetical protein